MAVVWSRSTCKRYCCTTLVLSEPLSRLLWRGGIQLSSSNPVRECWSPNPPFPSRWGSTAPQSPFIPISNPISVPLPLYSHLYPTSVGSRQWGGGRGEGEQQGEGASAPCLIDVDRTWCQGEKPASTQVSDALGFLREGFKHQYDALFRTGRPFKMLMSCSFVSNTM